MSDGRFDSLEQVKQSIKLMTELTMSYSNVIKEALLAPSLEINNLKIEFEKINIAAPKFQEISKQFDFGNLLREAIIPATINFKEIIDGFTPMAKDVLMQLGENGWYFDNSMPITAFRDIDEAFARNEIAEIERNMTEYFTNKRGQIEEYLINLFPERAVILSEAFKAHDKKKYYLSTPIFLMQADGICADLVRKKSLFRKKDKKTEIASHIEEAFERDSFERAMFVVLESVTAINMSKSERPKDRKILNRHQIIHGESLDYGTEINSLKAISFINYVAQSLIKLSETLKNDET